MVLAAVSLLLSAVTPEVWVSHKEVYSLAVHDGRLYAATSGGVAEMGGQVWQLGGAPGAVRKLLSQDGSLVAQQPDGTQWELRGGVWSQRSQPREIQPYLPEMAAPSGSGGAFLSAMAEWRGKQLYSFWGAEKLYIQGEGGWEAAAPRPQAEGDYDLAAFEGTLYAGTSAGLYRFQDNAWIEAPLHSELPFVRSHGLIMLADGRRVFGGLDGLAIGRPGEWAFPSHEPVRQLLRNRTNVWVLYGSGAVDRLDLKNDRLYYDVLQERAKRPWASCIAMLGEVVAFGSHGGWIERGEELVQHYPSEIQGDVVTAIAGRGDLRWIGTQRTGLNRFENGRLSRVSADAVRDPWITALLHTTEGLWIGTASEGLYLLSGDTVQSVPTPSKRIRHLALWQDELAVGTLDGAWKKDGTAWRPMGWPGAEVTGFTSHGNRLAVLHPSCVTWTR